MFSFSSNLLEKTSDAVLKAGKTGDLGLVSVVDARLVDFQLNILHLRS